MLYALFIIFQIKPLCKYVEMSQYACVSGKGGRILITEVYFSVASEHSRNKIEFLGICPNFSFTNKKQKIKVEYSCSRKMRSNN